MLAGFAFGRGDMSSGIANSIISVFWLGMLIIMHLDAVSDAKFDAEMRGLDRMTDMLKGLAGLQAKFDKVSPVELATDGAPQPRPAQTPSKKLTASQQRRINATKGHGPITDDELKAKRLEARRAKRAAAKKPATPKGQLPGQTELVPSEPTNKE